MQLSWLVFSGLATGTLANYPILSHKFQADPAPVVGADGRLYIHASHDKEVPQGFDMDDYSCFSTDDMVNWQDHGECFSPRAAAGQIAWAAQAVQYQGSFFLYYSARDGNDQSRSLGVWMTSGPTPLGPWEQPWQVTGPETSGGDPTAYVDPDDPSKHRFGQAPGGQSAKLSADMRSVPDQGELTVTFAANPSGLHEYYFEAPWYTKIDGRYVFSFMGTGFENPDFRLGGSKDSFAMYGHNILYMTCDDLPTRENPTGGCGPVQDLMWSPPDSRNNGDTNNQPGIIEYPPGSNKWHMAYHGDFVDFMDTGSANYRRSVGIDRVYWQDGKFLPFTASREWNRQLKYVDAYVVNQAESMSEQGCECNGMLSFHAGCDGCGICTLPSGNGGHFVGCWDRNPAGADYVKVSGVDFGTGSSSLSVRVASPGSGGILQVRLDRFHDAAACSVGLPDTGDWNNWVDASAPCAISGIHDVYFVHSGAHGFNFDSWKFVGGSASGAKPPAVARTVAVTTWEGQQVGIDDSGTVAVGAPHGEFEVHDNEDGSFAIRSTHNRKFVNCDPGQGGKLIAQSDQVITWERFFLVATPPAGGEGLRRKGTAYSIQVSKDCGFSYVVASPTLASGCGDPRKCPDGTTQFYFKDVGSASHYQVQANMSVVFA